MKNFIAIITATMPFMLQASGFSPLAHDREIEDLFDDPQMIAFLSSVVEAPTKLISSAKAAAVAPSTAKRTTVHQHDSMSDAALANLLKSLESESRMANGSPIDTSKTYYATKSGGIDQYFRPEDVPGDGDCFFYSCSTEDQPFSRSGYVGWLRNSKNLKNALCLDYFYAAVNGAADYYNNKEIIKKTPEEKLKFYIEKIKTKDHYILDTDLPLLCFYMKKSLLVFTKSYNQSPAAMINNGVNLSLINRMLYVSPDEPLVMDAEGTDHILDEAHMGLSPLCIYFNGVNHYSKLIPSDGK